MIVSNFCIIQSNAFRFFKHFILELQLEHFKISVVAVLTCCKFSWQMCQSTSARCFLRCTMVFKYKYGHLFKMCMVPWTKTEERLVMVILDPKKACSVYCVTKYYWISKITTIFSCFLVTWRRIFQFSSFFLGYFTVF